MSLQTVLQSIQNSGLSLWIRQNPAIFPIIESLHVVAITLVFGTIMIVDLRLLGFASHRRSANKLIAELLPFTWGAFILAVVTGSLLFTANAPAYANNTQFQLKMLVMLAAGVNMVIFHMTAHRRIAVWDSVPPPTAARLAGVTSLILWVAVIYVGRWIGFTLDILF
ncbi:DUF6644 family protein [Nitrospirillum sp. BR 11163]|uniref:DUF6644 family protein n=1 Tax=Nitrospirillum sp. BR 11163 TaxID=3104323 RepID=UPI002AFE61BE|nr:DUF6644 family protein [Nitrospirillum sp. BR 11163]MEA1674595.1 DUF6644 family protein [Nitrospirillum sp. BR 11163]